MSNRIIVRLVALLALLVAVQITPAWSQDKKPTGKALPVEDKPVGNVTMEFGLGGFILSATGGKGTLIYAGRKHVFKVGGLGVGGIGLSKITASGEVYNLHRLEDFAGAYFQARAGYTALDAGKGVQWLENSNGVVIKLKAVSKKGLALTLGADGLTIEMGAIKKAPEKKK